MSDEFLDHLGQVESKAKRPSPSHKNIASPLDKVAKSEARKSTHEEGKAPSMEGQQLRRSILIPPEMDDEINRICKKYRVRKMEMLRFLIAQGLEDVHNGVLEENMVRKVVIELPSPNWKGS